VKAESISSVTEGITNALPFALTFTRLSKMSSYIHHTYIYIMTTEEANITAHFSSDTRLQLA